jgi:superfamily II DNA or RNA helicase
MSIAASLSRPFSASVRSKGEVYAQRGQVSVVESSPELIRCAVIGSQRDPYQVFLRPNKTILDVACDCPHYSEGNLCKHLWAAIIQADREGLLNPKRFSRGVKDLDFEDILPEEDDALDRPGRPLDKHRFPTPGLTIPQKQALQNELSISTKTPAASADWRSAVPWPEPALNQPASLRRSAATPIQYVINVASSLATDSLVIETFRMVQRTDGTVVVVTAPINWTDGDLSNEDRLLFRRLEAADPQIDDPVDDWGFYGQSSYRDPSPTNEALLVEPEPSLLKDLCATGRLRWVLNTGAVVPSAPVVAWDAGPPYRLRMRATGPKNKKAKKEWTIEGDLVRGDEPPLPLASPVLILGRFLLFQDRIAEADFQSHARWVPSLRRLGRMTVPFADRDEFLKAIWAAGSPPELEFPTELTLTSEAVTPRPRLILNPIGPGSKVTAAVHFDYGECSLPVTALEMTCVSLETGKVHPRDRGAEESRLGELMTSGFELYRWNRPDDPHVSLPKRDLPARILSLTEAGWSVVADGKAIRRPGRFQISVTSGVDWFDMNASFDFDGVTARLPAILQAVEAGSKYVLLDDGTQGMLPEDWLKKYGGLSRLGETQGDAVRFRPSQAMLLDSLLSAQDDADVDQQFQEYRKRLRTFAGVRLKAAPKSFQGELRDYQKQGLGWLAFLRDFRVGGCLADDMGLGKTVQVLAHLETIRLARKKDGGKPSLVVVPKSLVFNWQDEAARFTPELKVAVHTGVERHEAFERLSEADLVVTTYGTLRKDIEALKEIEFDTVILDEAQAIKNAASNSAKACRLLRSDHRLAMTGTPIENHLGELWSLFEFLNPGMLGRSTAFQTLGRSTDGDPTALTLLARAIAPYVLRRTKAQVLTELPEKTEQTLYVELSAKERKTYNELRDHFRAKLTTTIETEGLAKSKIHVLEALLRLRQAACHPGLIDPTRGKDGSSKLDALIEQLSEAAGDGHKILVFSQFTKLLALVEQRLKTQKIPYEYLDGKTTDRKSKVSRFQTDEECQVFLISLKAGGHGLNLTAADYVFILDPWWNPAVEAQAIDRAHRMGQTRSVFAYRIIARDTVEEKVLDLQKRKKDLADAIISENESLIRKLTSEDLQLLLG